MPRAVMIDKLQKLQALEQKEKDAKAALRKQQKDLDAKLAEYERKARQVRLLTLGQLVQDTFGNMSLVEIAEILAEFNSAPVGTATAGYSSFTPSEKTETQSKYEKGE